MRKRCDVLRELIESHSIAWVDKSVVLALREEHLTERGGSVGPG